MSNTYTGNQANVSLASAVQTTTPADGDTRNAASVNAGEQKQDDYLEAIRQIVYLASSIPINEGFESVTFPPTNPPNAWAAPSPRYGADLAYVRDTSSPILGTASANRPGGQLANQNSSLGLSLYLASPARISFNFDVLGNATTDVFSFYIDGVAYVQLSASAGPVAQTGRFVSDVLREGYHTFDWRWARGAAASAVGEKARVDDVQVIAESVWPGTDRLDVFEDFVADPGIYSATVATGLGGTKWAGLFKVTLTSSAAVGGVWGSGTATGGWLRPHTGGTQNSEALLLSSGFAWPNGNPDASSYVFYETRVAVEQISNGHRLRIGISQGGWASPGNDVLTFDFDPVASANWRIARQANGGGFTYTDTGVAVVANTVYRLGLSLSRPGASGVSTFCAMINGKTTGGAVANAMTGAGIGAGVASSSINELVAAVQNPTTAADAAANIDYVRFRTLRT